MKIVDHGKQINCCNSVNITIHPVQINMFIVGKLFNENKNITMRNSFFMT